MKTKWFVMAMLTVLVGLSVSVVQVQAMTLDLSSGMQAEDGDGTVPEPAELYPVAMSDEGDGTTVDDPNNVPAE